MGRSGFKYKNTHCDLPPLYQNALPAALQKSRDFHPTLQTLTPE